MYSIAKEFRVETAHILDGSFAKECQRFHGHSAKIVLSICSSRLDDNGMVIDFKKLKEMFKPIYNSLDHRCVISRRTLFELFGKNIPVDKGFFPVDFNPTAENLAKWIYDEFNTILQSNKNQLKLFDSREEVVFYLNFVQYWETENAFALYNATPQIQKMGVK